MNDEGEMIVMRNVWKEFGTLQALRGVNLTVRQGTVLVIIGPSGSGKSTLLRCINRLETPTHGEIWVEGRPVVADERKLTPLRAEIGMVFQHFNLYPHLTVLENVTLAQRIVRKRSRQEAERIALEQLERVGIGEKAHNYPRQLSGGATTTRCHCARPGDEPQDNAL